MVSTAKRVTTQRAENKFTKQNIYHACRYTEAKTWGVVKRNVGERTHRFITFTCAFPGS